MERFQRSTRETTSTSPAGRVRKRTFDSLMNVTRDERPGSAARTYAYDARGRLESAQHGARHWSYSYGADGDVASTTDPLGRVTTIERDAAGRPTRRVLPGGRAFTYAWSAAGDLLSVTPAGRQPLTRVYDGRRRLTRESSPAVDGVAAVTEFGYDADDQLRSIKRSGGREVTFQYDANGRLEAVQQGRGTTTHATHPTTGKPTESVAPGGERLQFGFDGDYPTSERWDGTIDAEVSVSYDNRLRAAGLTVGGQTATLGYDDDNLLVSAGPLTLTREASGVG